MQIIFIKGISCIQALNTLSYNVFFSSKNKNLFKNLNSLDLC